MCGGQYTNALCTSKFLLPPPLLFMDTLLQKNVSFEAQNIYKDKANSWRHCILVFILDKHFRSWLQYNKQEEWFLDECFCGGHHQTDRRSNHSMALGHVIRLFCGLFLNHQKQWFKKKKETSSSENDVSIDVELHIVVLKLYLLSSCLNVCHAVMLDLFASYFLNPKRNCNQLVNVLCVPSWWGRSMNIFHKRKSSLSCLYGQQKQREWSCTLHRKNKKVCCLSVCSYKNDSLKKLKKKRG